MNKEELFRIYRFILEKHYGKVDPAALEKFLSVMQEVKDLELFITALNKPDDNLDVVYEEAQAAGFFNSKESNLLPSFAKEFSPSVN